MAEAGLFLGWGQVVRGREEQALERFNESMQFYARLQDQGRIESFDVALLTPHGGDLQGFILIRGSAEQIDSLRRDEEFERLQQKVDLIVDRLGSSTRSSTRGSPWAWASIRTPSASSARALRDGGRGNRHRMRACPTSST